MKPLLLLYMKLNMDSSVGSINSWTVCSLKFINSHGAYIIFELYCTENETLLVLVIDVKQESILLLQVKSKINRLNH